MDIHKVKSAAINWVSQNKIVALGLTVVFPMSIMGIAMVLDWISVNSVIIMGLIWVSMALLYAVTDYLVDTVLRDIVKDTVRFDHFRDNVTQHGFRYVIGSVLVWVFTILWSLLLIVPGIIKQLAYAMTPFVIRDNPSMSPLNAITESRRLMNGHKMDYVKMYFSLMWKLLLCIVALIIVIMMSAVMLITFSFVGSLMMVGVFFVMYFGVLLYAYYAMSRWKVARVFFYEALLKN